MNITIYSTSVCAACETLSEWLASKGYTYTKKIVDADASLMAEFMLVNDGMIGVPFSILTDENGTETKISGYDQRAFKAALKL